ncbi:Do family serine endopeptidase [Nitrospirillum viridazoti]|uniref:Probable periplasmic serine endoprotease DegP-like n=1 Tax=Nitrospirillum viridazoti CBAmc TaxID=1441467 RepID=A0A248JY67_9PROT|nr:Do family serine endopeptidase [Nitrospirillum amazonense]ASG23144.1 serine protease [Nitrospirillum amazonense CBAmc]TWB38891.1 serine protease Do [Nitrospirillum amazonense]
MTSLPTVRTAKKRFPRLAVTALAIGLMTGTALVAPPAAITAHAASPASLPSFADLVEKVTPAVVTITAAHKVTTPQVPQELQEMMRHFGLPDEALPGGGRGGNGRPRIESALGSGFVIDPSGYIVTNRHVIEGADEVKVHFQDQTDDVPAKIVGQDERSDLALLKVEPKKPLQALAFGDSDKMRPGDWVIAVGNPFGLGGTVTAGIVSARGRDIDAANLNDFLQIDASINKGNSGGPTFNANGEVIGINTAIFSPTGGSVGIGFAIPSNVAKPVIEKLKATGHVQRGYLGVTLQAVTPEIADSLGLKEPKGAIINAVSPKSPAEKGGLKQGDVVQSINGKSIDNQRDLARNVAGIDPGKTVDLGVLRGGKAITVSVKLGEAPNSGDKDNGPGGSTSPDGKGDNTSVAGLKLGKLDDRTRERMGLDSDAQGVVIVDPGKDELGLRPGDIIASVNNESVKAPADVNSQVEKAKKDGRKSVLLLVRRGDQQMFLPLPVTPKG